MAAWEERFQLISGLKTRYIVAGDGPTVLLVHGLGACWATWYENIKFLSQSFTVYALDLPGQGESQNPPGRIYDVPTGAAFLERFMDALNIETASLVGNSAGGGMVANLALASPQRVNHLVMVDSTGFGRPVSWFLRLASVPLLGEILSFRTIRSEDELLSSVLYRPRPLPHEAVRLLTASRNRRSARTRVTQAIRSGVNLLGVRRGLRIIPQLRSSNVPLLVVWGDQDRVFPVFHARLAAAELPTAVVHVMQDCGHWPHMEKPDEFNDLLMAFLKGHPQAL